MSSETTFRGNRFEIMLAIGTSEEGQPLVLLDGRAIQPDGTAAVLPNKSMVKLINSALGIILDSCVEDEPASPILQVPTGLNLAF